MKTYIIDQRPEDLHEVRITRAADSITIWTNRRELFTPRGGTCGADPRMAEDLLKGLLAILKGDFDEAITSNAFERRHRDEAERAARVPQSGGPPNSFKPSLGDL